jgi:myo-inositol 2-dehydrogenase/D-chiro-inositol 1-dehydrogenase
MSVRLGFIGTGGIAQSHMQRFSEMADVEMAAFCDVALERATAAAGKFGGKAYTDYRAMYDAEQLDGVCICTPPFAHGELETIACEKGIHLFIEKPVAIDMNMARPIREAIAQVGIISVVAYKYRWDDHVIRAKEMLAGKSIGLVFGNFWGGLPGTAWWRVQDQSGGQFVEQTTHIVDMARYLCGDVVQVQAFCAKQAMAAHHENFDIADAASANLLFASGAVGNISNTCMLKNWGQSSLRVMAHEFTLEIAGHRLSWTGDDSGEYMLQQDGYLGEDTAFVESIKAGKPVGVNSDYADACKSLAVSVAVNESCAQGGAVVDVAGLL